jgi:hypothetical protein
VDACDPVTGEVTHDPVAVDDGDACTADSCDPVAGVLHEAVDPGDGDACTVDACDPATGVANDPVAVDDGDACTVDACDPVAGVSHVPVTVDDGIPCTTDWCDPASGVAHAPDDLACGAGEVCDPVAGCVPEPAVGACEVNYPPFLDATALQPTEAVIGWILVPGVTEPPGQGAGVLAEVGYGGTGTDPSAAGWTWFATSYYGDRRDLFDAYSGAMLAPAAGTYDYLYRVTLDGGATYTYCDTLGIYDPGAPAPGIMSVGP